MGGGVIETTDEKRSRQPAWHIKVFYNFSQKDIEEMTNSFIEMHRE